MHTSTKLIWRMVLNAVAGKSSRVEELYEEYERAIRLHVSVREILEWKGRKIA
jgi:hypothetical protein